MKKNLNNWKLWLVVSLTLGLAPFVPEPHIVGKVRWIMGGAESPRLVRFCATRISVYFVNKSIIYKLHS